MTAQPTKPRQRHDHETVALIGNVVDRWQDMQFWSTEALQKIQELVGARPEHVVKAEKLREIANITVGELAGRSVHQYCRDKADELDPPAPPRPAEPAGFGAQVRDGNGKVWLRISADTFGWTDALDSDLSEYDQLDGPVTVLSEGVTE